MYNKAAYATYKESVADIALSETKIITFAGNSIELCQGLEIHDEATDDGVEYLITSIDGGDEYGVIRTDMSPVTMRRAAWAANEMFADHVADLANDKASNQDYWL